VRGIAGGARFNSLSAFAGGVLEQESSRLSTPDDHFAPGPDRRVGHSAIGRVGGARRCPSIYAGIVSAAGVQNADRIRSAPDDHFAPGPDCRVVPSGLGRIDDASRSPRIRAGIVSATGVQNVDPVPSAHTIISLPVQTVE
jgi:hypothetical protein